MSALLDMGCQAPAAFCHSSARSRLLAATSLTTSTRVSRLNMCGVTNPDDCNAGLFMGLLCLGDWGQAHEPCGQVGPVGENPVRSGAGDFFCVQHDQLAQLFACLVVE